jgi:hypothetical protein
VSDDDAVVALNIDPTCSDIDRRMYLPPFKKCIPRRDVVNGYAVNIGIVAAITNSLAAQGV